MEPIKPLMTYDPYLYDENVPMTMDEYYYDYYDDMPDVSALRGPAPSFNDLATPDNNLPPMSAEKVINYNLQYNWFLLIVIYSIINYYINLIFKIIESTN